MRPVAADQFVRVDATPTLEAGEVHVWLVVVHGTPGHRAVTAAASAMLGRLLADYGALDAAPDIERGKHGKPYAPVLKDLDFNLSHAGDSMLLAFARGQPLGVDLERLDRRVETLDLARRFFAGEEADALRCLPEADRLPAFLRIWTAKEAVLKAIGQGLGFGLDRVVFALDRGGTPARIERIADEAGPAEHWQIRLLEPAAGLVGALAWRGAPRPIRAFLADTDA